MKRSAAKRSRRERWIRHVVQNGARFHVVWWDARGAHCTEPRCEINRPTPASAASAPAWACVWCGGTGYVPETGVMCRTCHGSGVATFLHHDEMRP